MNTEALELYLPIDPADIPSAQQKGAMVRNGRIMFYEKSKVKTARKLITSTLLDLADGQRCEHSAYCVTIVYVYRPSTIKRKQFGMPKTTRPDIDNVTKLMLDAISDSHIAWADDGAVSTLVLRKRYAHSDEEAFVYIRIEEESYLKGACND